ncbi:MAG: hypothetical protein A2126_03965 [Candidatus Woykebacteria bacterium GWB1_45_5]|uniref:Uncharacterized protein n=1 Tax=Candidatus Woykebacteria bacterium GWB1_45_5 TaxID=1802592 RepID=A0A1G1W3R8_9BACT|nr:MAG: hypothetical protein A2126_03965 [Candidatus Woykebacteria bacterium GWB1_45_5]
MKSKEPASLCSFLLQGFGVAILTTIQGFSSLQEFVRVFLTELSQGNLKISFETAVRLTPKRKPMSRNLTGRLRNNRL